MRELPTAGAAARHVSMDAELTVGFLAFKESYVSRVTCIPYTSVEVRLSSLEILIHFISPQAVASSSTPLFRTLSTTWRFQPASLHFPRSSPHSFGEGGKGQYQPTLVTLDLAYAFASPLHASVSSAFFGQVSKLMVKAFEDRCLDVYGAR